METRQATTGNPPEPQFSISAEESALFARLSGDFNPVHLNALVARRTRYGSTVAHGIHMFLRAMDHLASRGVLDFRVPFKLRASFRNPLLTNSIAVLRTRLDGAIARFTVSATDTVLLNASIELKQIDDTDSVIDVRNSEAAAAVPDPVEFPPAHLSGTVLLRLAREPLEQLFPSLAALHNLAWIADLLATTQIVGMRCPGTDSIYTGFTLQRIDSDAADTGSMRYFVSNVDERFRCVEMHVRGASLAGTVEALFRRGPVRQRSMQEVTRQIQSRAFSNHTALIVGGSRGLGEVTAKILAAGGADVVITYAQGQQDAEQVCADIQRFGGRCESRWLRFPLSSRSAWLANSCFSHVYYFASPLIARNTGEWSPALFDKFTEIYVHSFAQLVKQVLHVDRLSESSTRFLYPSSIFVSQPEEGFAEYASAKAAGESLCDQLAVRSSARFYGPRLPRMRTDQTSELNEADVASSFAVMLKVVQDFHSM